MKRGTSALTDSTPINVVPNDSSLNELFPELQELIIASLDLPGLAKLRLANGSWKKRIDDLCHAIIKKKYSLLFPSLQKDYAENPIGFIYFVINWTIRFYQHIPAQQIIDALNGTTTQSQLEAIEDETLRSNLHSIMLGSRDFIPGMPEKGKSFSHHAPSKAFCFAASCGNIKFIQNYNTTLHYDGLIGALHGAIQSHQLDVVTFLLSVFGPGAQSNVTFSQNDLQQAFLRAAKIGSLPMLEQLNQDITLVTATLAFDFALEAGNLDVIIFLNQRFRLEQNHKIRAMPSAFGKGHVEVGQYIYNQIVNDIQAAISAFEALGFYAAAQEFEMSDEGANLLTKSIHTSLYAAAENGHIAAVEALLVHDFDDHFLVNVAHIAIENGHISVVKRLNENLQVNMTSPQGQNAILFAARNGHFKMIQYLASQNSCSPITLGWAYVCLAQSHDVIAPLTSLGLLVNDILELAIREGQLELFTHFLNNAQHSDIDFERLITCAKWHKGRTNFLTLLSDKKPSNSFSVGTQSILQAFETQRQRISSTPAQNNHDDSSAHIAPPKPN